MRGVVAEVAGKVLGLLVHGLLVRGQGVTVDGREAAHVAHLQNTENFGYSDSGYSDKRLQ